MKWLVLGGAAVAAYWWYTSQGSPLSPAAQRIAGTNIATQLGGYIVPTAGPPVTNPGTAAPPSASRL